MKLTRKDFTRQFYKGNIGNLCVALFAYTMLAVPILAVSFLIQQLVDIASGVDTVFTFGQTIALCGGGLGLFLIGYILEYVSRPRFICRAMSQYKNFVFEKLSKKNISAFTGENTSLYISALSNDANTIENDYLAQITTAFILIIQGAGALVMMLLYSPLLTLISIALMLIPVLVAVLTGNRLAKAEEQVSQKNAGFVSTLKDALTGFSVIKSFQAEIAVCKLFAESVKNTEDAKVSKRKIATILEMLGNISGIIAQIGVFVVGAGLAIAGKGISAGVVMAFVQLMNYLLAPVQTLPQFFASRKASHALIDKLAEALSANIRQDGEPISKELKTGIEVKNLTFGYTEEKTILKDIDFRFEAGKSYALVGASGSGKSTLLNLLMGGYGNYDGQILYDGQELHQIRSDSLYELISIIQQNVFVFNNTIHNNITMFHEFPKEKVEQAIELSGLSQLIRERGAEYLCGENGSGLSGGEKQRISIARSLLKESSVLLVDEATASLDAQTASQVASAILGLKGLTRIVVTHDLEAAVLKQYDCILALKNGTITESGTFDELMEQKQYFYSLYTVSQ